MAYPGLENRYRNSHEEEIAFLSNLHDVSEKVLYLGEGKGDIDVNRQVLREKNESREQMKRYFTERY